MEELDLVNVPLDGANLIESSAGTGKTYAIAGLFLRFLLERRFTADQILVVTFTEAATAELKDRIRTKIRLALEYLQGNEIDDSDLKRIIEKQADKNFASISLDNALRNFDDASIFTIHGFCQRVLDEFAFESGGLFDTELMTELTDLKLEIANDFWRRHIYSASPLFANFIKQKNCTPENFIRRFDRLIFRTGLEILPAEESYNFQELEKQFASLFKKLQEEWNQNSGDIIDFLKNFKGLNRQKYRKNNVDLWLILLDNYLHSDGNDLLFEKFYKFTLGEIGSSMNKGFDPPTLIFFELCDKLEKLYDILTGKRLLTLEKEFYHYLQAEFQKRKRKQNIRYYDDLLINLNEALERDSHNRLARIIRKKYKTALVDEFQDTDPIQYQIFDKIFRAKDYPLFFIGDPKQAIYGFRGADIFAYMRAAGEIDNRYTLNYNWRSEPVLIKAVNTLFENIESPFVYKNISFAGAKSAPKDHQETLTVDGKTERPLIIWFVDSGDDDSRKAIAKRNIDQPILSALAFEIGNILKLAEAGKISIDSRSPQAGDIAVLVRTNREARDIKAFLSLHNLPCVLYSAENLFDSNEALEIEMILKAIAAPYQPKLIRTALAADIMGLTGAQIFELIKNDHEWERRLLTFREYNEKWRRHGFFRMFSEFLVRENIKARVMAFTDGERRLTNILHLAELLHRVSIEKNLSMSDLLKWLTVQRNPETPRLEEHQLRLESDENAVKVITVHKSKGLEYPITFCPFTWEGSQIKDNHDLIFHDPPQAYRLILDLGSKDHEKNKAFYLLENLSENLRLFYVALTRAKNRCYLVWGKFNKAEYSAMAYMALNPGTGDAAELITKLKKGYSDISTIDFRERIESFRRKSDDTIAIEKMPDNVPEKYAPAGEISGSLSYRKFAGAIDKSWRIASFTYMISGISRSSEVPDHDPYYLTSGFAGEDMKTADEEESGGIYAFPKGPLPGIFFHDLLENCDFAADRESLEQLAKDKLNEYGYDLMWTDTISGLMENLKETAFDADGDSFKLSDIQRAERLAELEFYFPLKKITVDNLKQVFHEHKLLLPIGDFPESIDRLRFSPTRGFMKGFIDLVFRYNGRFYIIDWKSNFLGDYQEAYSPEKIGEVMKDSHYFLQYYIYTVALNKYLTNRQPGYDYKKHFGGIFYVFLRGIDRNRGNSHGIYYDLPAKEIIDKLSRTLMAV